MTSNRSVDYWPFPLWVAHRGGGLDAPENTMAAFKCGYEHGFRMFECDIKLSADGVPYLLHDPTLDRTTNVKGAAHRWRWQDLRALDAGAWHSDAYKNERLVSLAELARFCIEHDCRLNIEIKPCPGFERITGARVAEMTQELWRDSSDKPLMTSFDIRCLAASKATAPELPRGYLVHKFSRQWRTTAIDLQCSVVIV